MTACIFLGPSLPKADALLIYPQCRFLPPVLHGSIYEAVQRWPITAIGVIDGYFQHCPSVWHKEILWALDQGIHVAGAASMGALRAAELAPFGMVGIGKVFKAFEQGALPPFCGLNDDDEVAIVHGPEESGFVAVTEAMVNVRHTLDAACATGILDEHMAEILAKEAKSLHFSNRTYIKIIDQARKKGASDDMLQRFSDWLPTGRIDQKREDAMALIEHMVNIDRNSASQPNERFYFERTEIFDDAFHGKPAAQHSNNILPDHDRDVLDELRLNEGAYRNAKRTAIAKCVLSEQLPLQTAGDEPSTTIVSDQQLRQTIDIFRRTNGLLDRETIDQWLADNNLKLAEIEDLFLGEALLEANMILPDIPPISTELIYHLKLDGSYPPLADRARQKRDVLALQQRLSHPSRQLLNWYFETQHGSIVPADIIAYAQNLGLGGESELLQLLEREYRFVTQMQVDTTQ